MAQIDQKEYLKRYLSSDEQLGIKKKKKKKVAKSVGDRVKIIDDDIFTTHSQTITAEELLALNEEAPQIVGYVDERPLEMRIDDYRESGLWKPVSPTSNENVVQDNLKLQFAMKNENTSKKSQKGLLAIKDKKERNRAESPPRRLKCEESSPASNRSHVEKSNDWSPPRRKHRDEDSSPQRKSCVGDSPQRRFSSTDRDYSPPRKSRDDLSPRRVKDFSPRMRNRKGEDSSRKRNNDSLDRKQSGNDRDYCPLSKSRNDDLSTNRDKDFSPARRKRNIDSLENDKNYSPARKVNSDELSLKKQRNKDFSPKRYKYSHESDNRPTEIVRHSRKSENKTLNNFSKSSYKIVDKRKSSRWDSSPPRKYSDSLRDGSSVALKKLSKTLDGKTAGLQNAVELAKETAEYRRREDSLFRNMSENISGANASTVVRDKKTGKIRDLEKEAEDQKQKQQIEDKNAEKYSKWGKGLKQVEDRNAKLADDIHEMNKPLARYADDEDLEKFLKEQEREGDPMLAYIRKKKKKAAVEAGKPEKPQYEGEFMPNRFGIRPGYRWDGVDRSNGYEKKWFEKQNAKTAVEEEVYKWNVSDM